MKILQGKIEKMFKLQRSLEMLAHREMEKPDFSFAQVCSNDCGLNVSFTLLSFSFYRGREDYFRCPGGYSKHCYRILSHGYSRIHYFAEVKTKFTSPFIEEERTTLVALVATVSTVIEFFHMATVQYIILLK